MEPTWLYIFFLFGFKLVHAGIPTFVCSRDFSADSGIQGRLCPSVYLVQILIRLVRAGHVFSLKLLTNNYKLNVFGSFWSVRTVKDFKNLFIIGKWFGSIINPLTFKLIAREVSAAT